MLQIIDKNLFLIVSVTVDRPVDRKHGAKLDPNAAQHENG